MKKILLATILIFISISVFSQGAIKITETFKRRTAASLDSAYIITDIADTTTLKTDYIYEGQFAYATDIDSLYLWDGTRWVNYAQSIEGNAVSSGIDLETDTFDLRGLWYYHNTLNTDSVLIVGTNKADTADFPNELLDIRGNVMIEGTVRRGVALPLDSTRLIATAGDTASLNALRYGGQFAWVDNLDSMYYYDGTKWTNFTQSIEGSAVSGGIDLETDTFDLRGLWYFHNTAWIDSLYIARGADTANWPEQVLDVEGNIQTNNIYAIDTTVKIGKTYFISDAQGVRIGDSQSDRAGTNMILSAAYSDRDIFELQSLGLYNVALVSEGLNGNNFTGSDNVLIGHWTGYNLTSGSYNVFIGSSAGEHSSTCTHNISIGQTAGDSNQGNFNVFLGKAAGYKNSGDYNVMQGWYAGYNSSLEPGTNNVFLGKAAGYECDTDNNIMLGFEAGRDIEAGTGKNIFLGYEVGDYFGSGTASDMFLLDNEKATSDRYFLKGDMAANQLQIHGSFEVLTTGGVELFNVNDGDSTVNIIGGLDVTVGGLFGGDVHSDNEIDGSTQDITFNATSGDLYAANGFQVTDTALFESDVDIYGDLTVFGGIYGEDETVFIPDDTLSLGYPVTTSKMKRLNVNGAIRIADTSMLWAGNAWAGFPLDSACVFRVSEKQLRVGYDIEEKVPVPGAGGKGSMWNDGNNTIIGNYFQQERNAKVTDIRSNTTLGMGIVRFASYVENNTIIGEGAAYGVDTAINNTLVGSYNFYGHGAADSLDIEGNVVLGRQNFFIKNDSILPKEATDNIVVGNYNDYYNNNGSGNIHIGHYIAAEAWYDDLDDTFAVHQGTESNKGNDTTALLWGTFDKVTANQTLKVNGDLTVTGTHTLFAEMHFYESAGTETIGQSDQYYAINGEFSAGDLLGWTFVAGSVGLGNITTAAAGAAININDATHGLVSGDYVNVQSANHNGTSVVTYVDADNFTLAIAYVGDEASTWQEGDYLLAGVTTAGKYKIDASMTASAGAASKNYKFEAVQNATHIDDTAFEITTQGTNHQSGTKGCIITVVVGDRIWFQFKNETDTEDLNYEHGGIVIIKL